MHLPKKKESEQVIRLKGVKPRGYILATKPSANKISLEVSTETLVAKYELSK